MPFNARWRCVKIVEPTNPSRAQELVGGLKNAFERGESFAKAKQSFINAGYNSSEVGAAAQEMRRLISSTSQSPVTLVETKSTHTPKTKRLPTTSKIPSTRKKGISKALVIILITILISILLGAAVLGLFWEKWF